MAAQPEPLFEDRDQFSGTVEVTRRIFAAEEDGYAILEVCSNDGEEFVLAGTAAHLAVGERARVTGRWETHDRYGPQLKVESALPMDPEDREGQIAYLGTLKNIGPVRAETLVEIHGPEVLERISEDPEAVFGGLPRMSKGQARAAADSWYETRAVRDLHVELAPHGLSHLAPRIHARFREKSLAVLANDPYSLTEVEGVGFKRADAIAIGAGIDPGSDRRVQAATLYLLAEAEKRGHTHLSTEAVGRELSRLLDFPPEEAVVLATPGLVEEEGRLYREATLASEKWCAADLAARALEEPCLGFEPQPPDEDELTGEQWQAVREAFAARVSVITGGPGVGKTVCTRAIVESAVAADLTVALCAPTGRAARRLSEATGQEAETIHRLLEWRPGDEPGFGPEKPLPADLVVIDEASMVNLRMAELLLKGIGHQTHLVLVGDADQLPPIGAGKPFSDLVDSGVVPLTRLTHIFRQAARSMIITAAHSVNRGERPDFEPGVDQERDFFFLERPSEGAVADAVVELISERVSEGLGLDPIRDAQALVPVYRGATGIDALNERLQARLNPTGEPALNDRFRIGDRLIQTRNAHELGLMNGTICFLVGDDPEQGVVRLLTDAGESITMAYDDSEFLRLAYAISVHKSQGSEIPVVVFVCHRSHAGMLTRPLVYTAITRARDMCVLVGETPSLERAVRRDESGRRHSYLAERLREAAGSPAGLAGGT